MRQFTHEPGLVNAVAYCDGRKAADIVGGRGWGMGAPPRPHLPPPRKVSGIPLLSVRNIIDGEFRRRDDDSLISQADYEELCRSFVPLKNDVLLAIVGATIGKVATVPEMEPFQIQRSLAVFRARPGLILHEFLEDFFRGPAFQRALWTTVAFSAQPGIYLNTLRDFSVLVPPLGEQGSIVAFLRGKLKELDHPIRTARREIELIREYQTSLIADVVTGKLDVREAAARLPQEGPEAEPLDEMEDLSQDEAAAEDLEPEAADAA